MEKSKFLYAGFYCIMLRLMYFRFYNTLWHSLRLWNNTSENIFKIYGYDICNTGSSLWLCLLDVPIAKKQAIWRKDQRNHQGCRGRSRIFLRRGCTCLLLFFNTNKPHSFCFCRIPVVLEKCRSSQGEGGAHPLHPPPRSAPGMLLSLSKSVPHRGPPWKTHWKEPHPYEAVYWIL